jgi:hypothetical protein
MIPVPSGMLMIQRIIFKSQYHLCVLIQIISIQSRELHLQSVKLQDAQKGRPARPEAKPTPQVYPLGYIEDVGETRTKLAAFFIILPKKDWPL